MPSPTERLALAKQELAAAQQAFWDAIPEPDENSEVLVCRTLSVWKVCTVKELSEALDVPIAEILGRYPNAAMEHADDEKFIEFMSDAELDEDFRSAKVRRAEAPE